MTGDGSTISPVRTARGSVHVLEERGTTSTGLTERQYAILRALGDREVFGASISDGFLECPLSQSEMTPEERGAVTAAFAADQAGTFDAERANLRDI